MKYRFTPEVEKTELIYPSEGLIPQALRQAQEVKPDPSIQPFWTGEIMRDIEANRPSHWRRFLKAFTREAWAAIP